ncbi:hypothetical protein [Streptomyces sp. NPDC050263]|uniref:hypothetical protein n=1 Tax=Streptomyces sp. NPDC050263 TaxID=3155037 RepID=UPI003433AE30
MRLPTGTLLTACALSAAFLVAGRGGAGADRTMPGSEVVLPAAEGRALFADPDPGLDADAGVDPAPDPDVAPDVAPDLDRGLAPDVPDVFDPNAIGPETVPEIPDLLDGGGLIPDGPDESGVSGATDASGIVFGSPADALSG